MLRTSPIVPKQIIGKSKLLKKVGSIFVGFLQPFVKAYFLNIEGNFTSEILDYF